MNRLRLIAILGVLALLYSCGGGFNPFDLNRDGEDGATGGSSEETAGDETGTEDPADDPGSGDPAPEPEPEPVEVEVLPSDANGSLEDLGWEGEAYEVVNGVISYNGAYDGWATITPPAFDVAPTATEKVVVNMDVYYDMTTADLKTIKGDRLSFYLDLDGLDLHFKPRTNNDPGNKYLGAGDFANADPSEQTVQTDEYFKWNDYYTAGQTWYNIRFEIYESGEVRALYDGADVGLSVTVPTVDFTSLVVSFRGLSKNGIEYGLQIDNLTVTLEEIES